MSRAFVKEDASGEDLVIPQRPPLPPGTPNWVTPRGLALLRAELAELSAQRERLLGGGDARQLALVEGQMDLLESRLASAQVVEPTPGAVGVGAAVRLLAGGQERRLFIVGVDEADPTAGRVAFTAPVAQALLGRRPGDEVRLRTAKGEQVMTVVGVEYGEG